MMTLYLGSAVLSLVALYMWGSFKDLPYLIVYKER